MAASVTDLAARFSGRLLTAPDDMAPFLTDWRNLWTGEALAVAQPKSTADVATIVRWCAERRVPIVPQGGNTSMSGGATPDQSGDALILSLSKLNRVRAVDPINNTITVDAGCILEMVQQYADEAGRLFPLSLAAEGSCTIGGNLATNAGGTSVLRYGNARDLCLGLEVVTAAGEVWDGLRGLRKDNSGYDLRDLFIGSEGTLGVITGAVLKLFPKPAGSATAFAGFAAPSEALTVFTRLRAQLDSKLSAVELLSNECLRLVCSHFPELRSPLQVDAPWYVLVELSHALSDAEAHDALEAVLASAMEDGLIADVTIAATIAQASAFWRLREDIAEAQGAEGKTIKHDISLPISEIPAFLEEAGRAIAARWPDIRFITFGHIGDGNLHYNFSPPRGGDQVRFYAQQSDINRVVHDIVMAHGGSLSAEHGLGVLRRDEAAHYKSPVELALMRAIKAALDPDGIMNPGKVLA